MSDLWQRITVNQHSFLGDYDGIFAAAQGAGCHGSTPAWIDEEMRESLSRQGETVLMSSSAYERFASPAPLRACTLDDLDDLRAAVSTAEWEDAGFDDDVLVRPDRRGQGLASLVGRAATSHAVTRHGIARWCARESNTASLRTAAGLGFEPYCRQMAVRRKG